jgi:hypothetical protein
LLPGDGDKTEVSNRSTDGAPVSVDDDDAQAAARCRQSVA